MPHGRGDTPYAIHRRCRLLCRYVVEYCIKPDGQGITQIIVCCLARCLLHSIKGWSNTDRGAGVDCTYRWLVHTFKKCISAYPLHCTAWLCIVKNFNTMKLSYFDTTVYITLFAEVLYKFSSVNIYIKWDNVLYFKLVMFYLYRLAFYVQIEESIREV